MALAPAGSPWVCRVEAWALAGALPLDVRVEASGAAVRAALGATRPVSAVLVDGTASDADRDALVAADCPVVVVHDGVPARWWDLGPAAVLPPDFPTRPGFNPRQWPAARLAASHAFTIVPKCAGL